jgi:hypothetical protein
MTWGPLHPLMFHGYLLLNGYIGGATLATIMAYIRNQIICVRIPGLPENTCYIDHLREGVSRGRNHCVGGFRLMINAAFPFLYPNIQDQEMDSLPLSPVPLVTHQPKKTE